MKPVKEYDISKELSRTYLIYVLNGGGPLHETFIAHPKKLFWAEGHAFHRIFDGEKMHLCPVPGVLFNTNGDIIGYVEVTWKPSEKSNPCNF